VTIATINGTMLVPGVSLNNRLYTAKAIGKAVKRMQEKLADPDALPIVMRTHHQAGDDSRLIVGKLTSVNLEDDGSATYQAQLYGTHPGKDIAALVTGKDPALRSVSISGNWLGPVRTVEYQGKTVDTADDLEVNAVDFTATPGVLGALISRGTQATTESASDRTPISEDYGATVTITEEAPPPALEAVRESRYRLAFHTYDQARREMGLASLEEPGVDELNKTPYGDVKYADPGKQADGVKRYPIDTAAHAKAAWSYINMPKNANKYSSSDLAAIKGRIKGAMRKFGIKVGNESTEPRYGEIREYYPDGPNGNAGLCIDAYAGPLSVTFRACNLDASSLKAVGAAAMDAATSALAALDPDTDGDIDVPGAPAEDDDNDMGHPVMGGESSTTDVEGSAMNETEVRALVQQMLAERAPEVAEATADDNMEAMGGDDGDDGSPPGTPDSHAHVHDMADGTTHTHGHLHTHESAGGGLYDHTHGHDHFHLPGGDESHTHTHNHDHATAPDNTHETTTTEKETAMSESEITPAAQAAPVQAITLEHVTALTQAIAALAEAVKPVPAAVPAEETAAVVPAAAEVAVVAETVPTPAPDFEAMKREVLGDLRNQVLKEFGLPSRAGYRLTETDTAPMTPEQERQDAWSNRAALLLGNYGVTPTPIPGTGIAAQ
jgi:hypothetical protein